MIYDIFLFSLIVFSMCEKSFRNAHVTVFGDLYTAPIHTFLAVDSIDLSNSINKDSSYMYFRNK